MSSHTQEPSIYWLGSGAALPDEIVGFDEIRTREGERLDAQLRVLSPALRERIMQGLGIEAVRVHRGPPSVLALDAARNALHAAGLDGTTLRLVIDYSTLPADYPAIWSLAHRVADGVGAADALCLGVHGGGCAGLLLALRTARALLRSDPDLGAALLVATDCVPSGGRCCLPISVMGDAASAVVLGVECRAPTHRPRVLSVTTSAVASHHAVIVAEGCPAVPEVNGVAFEERVLPIHFLMLHRVLSRALEQAGKRLSEVSHWVYPNTSALDRAGVARALGFSAERLSGPGPRRLGHTFANDLVLNFPVLPAGPDPGFCAALLAVGSGFSWGAALVG